MRKPTTILAIAITIVLTTTTAMAQRRPAGAVGAGGAGCGQILLDRFELLPVETLSDAESSAVVHLREEEKLARDVYATLALSWDIPVFTNIARAEQRHMSTVKLLLDRYSIVDPVRDDAIGAFTDAELGALYDELVAIGERSLEDALAVGATIEDLDLADLGLLFEATDNADVALVAHNLAKGSRNHLRAFSRAMATNGAAPYVAQYLTQDEVDAIIASEPEVRAVYDEFGDLLGECGGMGRGQGRGRGGRGGGSGECDGTGPHGGGNGQGSGGGTCP